MGPDDIGANHVKFGTVMDTDDVQNGLGQKKAKKKKKKKVKKTG